jgi:hypothetical protein
MTYVTLNGVGEIGQRHTARYEHNSEYNQFFVITDVFKSTEQYKPIDYKYKGKCPRRSHGNEYVTYCCICFRDRFYI